AYRELKTRLFARQAEGDWAVLNLDDPAVSPLAGRLTGQVFPFSRQRRLEEGVFVADGDLVVRRQGRQTRLLAVADLGLPGRHNLENALAAAAAATLAEVS